MLEDGTYPASFRVSLQSLPPVAFAGSHGEFHLTNIPARRAMLAIAGSDFRPESLEVELVPDEEVDVGVIVLHAGSAVTGRVVDHHGNAMANAHVVASESIVGSPGALTAGDTSHQASFQTILTDGHGRFRFEHLPAKRLSFIAYKGTASSSVLTATAPAERDLTLEISTGTRLHGRVTQSGHAVAHVKVTLLHNEPDGSTAFAQILVVTTDELGHYVFDNVSPGSYTLAAVEGSQANLSVASSAQVEVKGADDMQRDLTIDGRRVSLILKPDSTTERRTVDISLLGPSIYHAVLAVEPVKISNVRTGAYRLCSKLRETEATNCREISVTDDPAEQVFAAPSVKMGTSTN